MPADRAAIVAPPKQQGLFDEPATRAASPSGVRPDRDSADVERASAPIAAPTSATSASRSWRWFAERGPAARRWSQRGDSIGACHTTLP